MRLLRFAPLVFLTACRSLTAPDGPPAPPESGARLEAPPPSVVAAVPGGHVGTSPGNAGMGTPLTPGAGHELAAFAGGCFWGTEDAFRKVPGVLATAVGYTGGHTVNPTYEVVCDHESGHAEAVLVEFDPAKITYSQLVSVFFQIHDATTLDRQGPDVGDQYRSAIFTFSPAQESAARAVMGRAQAKSSDRIVTKVSAIGPFYKAEGYHQQYAERTGHHGCPVKGFVIEGT